MSRFVELFQYNKWANQKVLGALCPIDSIPDRSISLLSHIAVAEIIWFGRILKKDYEYHDPWELVDRVELPLKLHEFDQKWLDFISQEDDFQQLITYQNMKGDAYSNKLSDIAIHVVNHSTYHRGQIAIDLSENGMEAVSTDYIFYKRQ